MYSELVFCEFCLYGIDFEIIGIGLGLLKSFIFCFLINIEKRIVLLNMFFREIFMGCYYDFSYLFVLVFIFYFLVLCILNI